MADQLSALSPDRRDLLCLCTLRAAQLLPHEEAEVAISHALGPFLFRPLGSDRVLAITMPMQLPSTVAEPAAAGFGV